MLFDVLREIRACYYRANRETILLNIFILTHISMGW